MKKNSHSPRSQKNGKKIDRRSFVKLIPAAGAAGLTITEGDVTSVTAQQPQPGSQRITQEMLTSAEKLIGIELTDAHAAMALPGVNRNLGNYEALRQIDVPL